MEIRNNFQFDPFDPNQDFGLGSDSLDIDSIDWSDPGSFMKSLAGTDPEILSPEQVRQQTLQRKTTIFTSYDELRSIIERHEATIQKRWMKKTRQQRLAVLLQAWPNMAESHRPDFKAFRMESPQQREAGTKFKSHYMWPYVNQEDLCKTKLFPMLLNARARHPPWAFAAADRDAMQFGMVTKALVPAFLNTHTAVLNCVSSREQYGKLISWGSDAVAMEWATSRREFLPGEGLIILEAQDKLLQFLVACCRTLLHDIPASELTSDASPVQPEPALKFNVDAAGFVSLAAMAEEAPYRTPSKVDFGKLAELLEAKRRAVEDHLWALREDPAYFAQELLEAKDHRPEFVKDDKGRPHPLTSKHRENQFWTRIVGNLLFYSYKSLEVFSELHRQAQNLYRLQQKYQKDISPIKDLPEELLVALVTFRHFLNQVCKSPLNQLKSSVAGSPPMRKFFVRSPGRDMRDTDILIRDRNGKKTEVEKNLTWLLHTLSEDGWTLLSARLPLVVDELERVIQTEPAADSLISAHVMKIIDDLSIMSHCLKQTESYYPWALGFEQSFYARESLVSATFKRCNRRWRDVAAFNQSVLVDAATLADPSHGKFTYPYDKRRTRDNVEALRKAEANLDSFWTTVDRISGINESHWSDTALYRLLSQPRSLRRTAEWVEPINAKPSSTTSVEMLEKPLSNLFITVSGSEAQPSRTIRNEPSKVKVKTRGAPSTEQASSSLEGEQVDLPKEPDHQPTFDVDARALKVFRLLFFNPNTTSTPGTISWTDFLHAMTTTGFQTQKLYGSVWQFVPTKLDVERGIHFHEPHPKGKLEFAVARRYGRRLTRTYGWHGSMFVLKNSQAK